MPLSANLRAQANAAATRRKNGDNGKPPFFFFFFYIYIIYKYFLLSFYFIYLGTYVRLRFLEALNSLTYNILRADQVGSLRDARAYIYTSPSKVKKVQEMVNDQGSLAFLFLLLFFCFFQINYDLCTDLWNYFCKI